MEFVDNLLTERAGQGLLRTLNPLASRHNHLIQTQNPTKNYIDFSNNDYLGLASHPAIKAAACQALEQWGNASTASRLLSGDLSLHHQLEEKVAALKQKPAALVFNSGYQANVGIISALYGKGDVIFADRLSHASMLDGALLSGARLFRFRHQDTAHLATLLQKERAKYKHALIMTESVFSMDGDLAPLPALVDLKNHYNCQLFVDEAHATGIFGPNGGGLVEAYGLANQVDLIMGTFSKALAGFGAYVAADNNLIQYLINTARSFIYSTALPPVIIAMNLASIELLQTESHRRQTLLTNAAFFRAGLKAQGFPMQSETQIIPLLLGDVAKANRYAAQLAAQGFWVLPIRPPTVPEGEARLRFSVTYCHNKAMLEKVLHVIASFAV
jgi:8-amino-7-oxononanoate synthase